MAPLAIFVVVTMALFYGYLADHAYTVWRKGCIPMGLSRCDGCERRLSWEMTPVLGYIVTGGRCKRCDLVVPPAYPLVEIAGVLLGIATATMALRTAPEVILSTWLAGLVIGYAVAVTGAFVLHRIAPPR